MARIVVIGGGITGLACALRLQDFAAASARAQNTLTLIEAAPGLGGKLVTHQEHGFVVDAGADIFLASKPGAMELCARLGISGRVVETDPSHRRTFVREGVTLVPATHYGAERLATLPGGMQELVDSAARALRDVEVVTSSPVDSITADAADARYQVHASDRALPADAVVIAVPAHAGAVMLRRLVPDAAVLLETITYRSSFTVSAAYRAADVPHALDGYGYVVPDAHAGEVSACTWTSSKIPSRAPAGHVLLRGYVHGAPGLSTDDARRLVLDEFRRVLGIEAPPLFTRAHAWQDALPALDDARSDERRAAVRAALTTHQGIAIAGGAVDGIGIPDSIRSGQAAAERIWHELTTSRAEEATAR